jgi:hypothetical protein
MSEIGSGTAPPRVPGHPGRPGGRDDPRGVRLVGTALAYTRPGVESYAESVVARAVAGRDRVVVAAVAGRHG